MKQVEKQGVAAAGNAGNALKAGQAIPQKYTGDSENTNPIGYKHIPLGRVLVQIVEQLMKQ